MNIPLLTSLTGSSARSYESKSNIARSVPEPACPAFKSSRADWKRRSMEMAWAPDFVYRAAKVRAF
jgi:hypothetical protein